MLKKRSERDNLARLDGRSARTIIVDVPDAKTQLSRLIGSIERGEASGIIITRDGKPVARPLPIETKPDVSKRLGIARGCYRSMSLEEFNKHDKEIARLFLGDENEEW